GLLEAHEGRDALQVDGRHGAILGVTAVQLAAEPLLPLAELVAPVYAGRARAALDAVLDDDPIPRPPAADARPEGRDLARDVQAEERRERAGRRAARAQAQIRVVERGRAHADDHLARAGRRIRAISVDELLRPAVLGDVDRLHRMPPTCRPARLPPPVPREGP